MSNLRFKTVYKVLTDHNFEVDNEISGDVLCTICHKILIDARSAPCGCRFCLGCISTYLDGEDKLCPGSTAECKIELLNINENIQIDEPMNFKISRLIVKCPEQECNFKDQLKNLANHIRICNSWSTKCPFIKVGCDNVEISKTKIEEHLLSENPMHTKLLMECIDIIRNDMNELKKEIVEMKQKQVVGDGLESVIAQQSDDIEKLNADIVAVGNVHRSLEEKLNRFGTQMEIIDRSVLEMKTKVDKQIIEMELERKQVIARIDKLSEESVAVIAKSECNFRSIEDKLNNFVVSSSEMKSRGDKQIIEIEKLTTKCLQVEQEGKKFETRIDKISDETDAIAAKIENSDGKIANFQMKFNETLERLDKLDFGEFVWKIENFSDKRNQARNGIDTEIYSNTFHSHRNGYKLCLRIDPNGNGVGKGSHLSVFFIIIRGPFDNILQWPFKHDVTLALINQQTCLDHASVTTKYDNLPNHVNWNKPTEVRNIGFGTSILIKLVDLMNNVALCQNDTIFIKCIVHK